MCRVSAASQQSTPTIHTTASPAAGKPYFLSNRCGNWEDLPLADFECPVSNEQLCSQLSMSNTLLCATYCRSISHRCSRRSSRHSPPFSACHGGELQWHTGLPASALSNRQQRSWTTTLYTATPETLSIALCWNCMCLCLLALLLKRVQPTSAARHSVT